VLGNNGEIVSNSVEQFNQHQIDVKNRLNFLVQSVLLLSGGALSASIAIFTGSRSIQLSHNLASTLGFSWWLLVASICLAVVVVAIIILRDYFMAEEWRKQMNDSSIVVDDSPGWPDKIIIAFGVLSLISFLAGFIGIAFVATSVVVA
jgi:hypothetical protein